MKLIYNNRNNAYTTHYKSKQQDAQGQVSPKLAQYKDYQNQINFTGASVTKIISSAQEITGKLDEILGDSYFSKKLNLSGFLKDGNIELPIKGFWRETGHAARRTLLNLLNSPIDIINSLYKKAGKEIPEGILKNRDNALRAQEAQEIVQDILSKFLEGVDDPSELDETAVEKLANAFKRTAALNITDLNASYRSADERALNRIGTSFVSAIFSGYDFYNITMLQKDDKNEAEKEERKRFNLDFTRCFTNAAITFVLMSLFEKPINKSMGLSAGVLIASSLISEILTRIKKGEPLKRLTPQEAKEIAQKRNKKNNSKEIQKPQELKPSQELKPYNKEMSFSEFLLETAPTKNIPFTSNQNKQATNNEAKNEKKDKSLAKNVAKIMGIASLAFLGIEILNGNLPAKIKRLRLHKEHDGNFSDDAKKIIKKTFSDNLEKSEKINILKRFSDAITKTDSDIDLTKLIKRLEEMKKEKNLPIIEEYIKIIEERIAQKGKKIYEANGSAYLKSSKNIPVVSAVAEGVSRLFKNVYQILSLPGRALNIILNNTIFKNSEKAAKEFKPKYSDKQIEILHNIIEKQDNPNFMNRMFGRLSSIFNKEQNNDALSTIQQNIRNFKEKPETGELASLSRTAITIISSWFMINDYSNKVLIQSEGRDIEGAEEERIDRLMQKVSNFFFNGTLMNIANTLFKGPLNRSLLWATIIPMGTEWINQILVRKSICQPTKKMDSKDSIQKYEQEQLEQDGFMGWWTKTYTKLTGKKTLSQKANISENKAEMQKAFIDSKVKAHQG